MLCVERLHVDWTLIRPARDAVGYCITYINKLGVRIKYRHLGVGIISITYSYVHVIIYTRYLVVCMHFFKCGYVIQTWHLVP